MYKNVRVQVYRRCTEKLYLEDVQKVIKIFSFEYPSSAGALSIEKRSQITGKTGGTPGEKGQKSYQKQRSVLMDVKRYRKDVSKIDVQTDLKMKNHSGCYHDLPG